MNLNTGGVYVLRNEETRETAQFKMLEMIEKDGQLICYGETVSHTIHVPATKGIVPVPARPSCFPVFPKEPSDDVLRFMVDLDSLPLVLVLDPDHRLPVININRAPRYPEKDGLIREASELIEAWTAWKKLGCLPIWMREVVRA